jgi:hypothetical protein
MRLLLLAGKADRRSLVLHAAAAVGLSVGAWHNAVRACTVPVLFRLGALQYDRGCYACVAYNHEFALLKVLTQSSTWQW